MRITSLSWFRRIILIFLAISAFILVACSSATEPTSVLPTSTLIPPTLTPVTIPPTPTETPAPAIRAAALAQEIPPSIAELEDEQERSVALQVFNALKAERIEQGLTGDLRLLQFESAIWSNERLLGCPPTSESATIRGYRVVFASDNFIYEYHTGQENSFRLCSARNVIDAKDDLLILVDLAAGELFALAQQRLSRERDIPSQQVELASMRRIVWPDSGLGCASSDTPSELQAIDITGYRLVVRVGDEQIIFHTDFESIRQCALEDEILPDVLSDLTKEPTSTP